MSPDRIYTLPEVIEIYLLALCAVAIVAVLGISATTIPALAVCAAAIAAPIATAHRRARTTTDKELMS